MASLPDALGVSILVLMSSHLGEAWARAVAAKDHDSVRMLLHPELDFRAMTPGRVWEAADADDVIDALSLWFGDSDHIERLVSSEHGIVADTERVSYRLQVRRDDGPHLVEQQMYLRERDGRIGYARIMCSGYRPVDDSA
jgi:hypothetical protein